MNNKKTLLAIVLCSTLLFAWCTDNINQNTAQPIKIWFIAPLSWPVANYGLDAVNAFKDSLEKFKAQNPDIKIETIIEDGKCDWKDGASAWQKLITVDKVDVILWWWCSSETIAAGQIAQDNNITIFSAWSSSPAISDLWDYVFRLRNDAVSAIKLNNYISKNHKRIAIIYENTDFWKWIINKFKTLYTWEISIDIPFSTDEKDFSIIANTIKANWNNIDGILLMNWADAGAIGIIKALQKAWIYEQFRNNIVGVYQLTSKAFLEWVGLETAEWLKQVNIDLIKLSGERWQKYIDAFKQKYWIKWVDQYILVDVEWAEIIFDAIKEWARSSEDFKNYFEGITENNKRNSLLWDYYFDAQGDAVGFEWALVIEEIKNGKWVAID